jgi:hypothetical protein
MSKPTRKERVTVRLTPRQMLCLKELSTSLNTSYSLLIRTIIQDFLTKNEDALDRITSNKSNQYANTEDYFEED